jgi:nitrogen fixation protein NifU and related proteins
VSGDAIYHDALVRLAREATGAGRLAAPTASAARDNPLCGDRVAVEVLLSEGRIGGLAHQVRGCVLCQAAASFLGRAAPGATAAEMAAGRAQVAALLSTGAPVPEGRWREAAVFEPVGAVKSRHGCVLLPFDTLSEALAAGKG